MKNKELAFYVLNWDSNGRKAEMFNIFRNWKLAEAVEKEVKRYLQEKDNYKIETDDKERAKLNGYEALKAEIDNLIRWQEWARCEYEIMVGSLFEENPDKFEKWDCYSQAHANIDLITDMCINYFK